MSCPIMTPLIREWAKEFGLLEQQALIDYGLAQARVGNLEITKEQFKAEVERQKQLKQTNQQMTQQSQPKVDALKIADKTATNGVIIDTRLKSYTDEGTKAIARQWLKSNPNGIVAFRLSENYNTVEMAKAGAIGNPFNWQKYGTGKATQMFYDWLTTGNNFGETLANEDYRQAILDKLNSIDTPNILYYKELGYPSHATVLGYLINHKNLLEGTSQSLVQKTGEISAKDFPSFYEGNITPDANTIFVFGSNPEGRHGAGAAKVAREQFGAIYGQGEGLQGNAYALPTKDLRVKENRSLRSIPAETIVESIKKLYDTARQNPTKQFKVAYRNTTEASLNGYTGLEMIQMFKDAKEIPSNIVFSKEWVDTGMLTPTTSPTVPQGVEGINPTGSDILSMSLPDDSELPTPQKGVTPPKTVKVKITGEMPQVSVSEMVVKEDEENPFIRFSRTFSPTEKSAAVEAITTDFIDIVDEETEFSDDTKVRQAYIKANVPYLIETLRKQYRDYLTSSFKQQEDEEMFGKEFVNNKITYINKILADNNLEILLKDAAFSIERKEKIAIRFEQGKANETEIENTQTDPSDTEEEAKDGWMIKVREVDPRLTLAGRVNKAIASTPKVDNDGNPVYNIMGKPVMLDSAFVHAVLMNELSTMAYVEDFIKGDNTLGIMATERMLTKYPWLKSLNRTLLSDPSLMSQFYTDFRKDFIMYTEVIDVEDEEEVEEETKVMKRDAQGNYLKDDKGALIFETIKTKQKVKRFRRVTKNLNEAVALDSAMRELIENYENNEQLSKNTIYNNGKIVEEKRQASLKVLKDFVTSTLDSDTFKWNDEAKRKEQFNKLLDVLHSVGFNTQLIDLEAIYNIDNYEEHFELLTSKLNVILGQKIKEDVHLIDSFNDAYSVIANIVGRVSEIMNVQSFRTGDKMYYSYSPTNSINTMIKKFKDSNDERRAKYIEEQFGQYEWYYDHKNGRWRNYWAELLESNSYVREHLEIENHATSSRIKGKKHETTSYKDWEQSDMLFDFLLTYYSIPVNTKTNIILRKFNTPIYSDSPVVNFITMPSFEGDDFKDQILERMLDVVEQEMERIKDVDVLNGAVQKGELKEGQLIANYKNANKFLFFPRLNELVDYKELNNLYEQGNVDEARTIIKNALATIMVEGAEEYRQTFYDNINLKRDSNTLFTLRKNGIIKTETNEEIERALDIYYWNQAYATTQIIQLTTVDLAYYKNGVDFQKRYKEVYATGNKLNTKSTYGREKEKVLYLKDEIITSSSILDIEEALDQAVKEGRISTIDKKAIISKFKEINVADAQAYRSISSMKAVLDMMGQWTPEMEEAVDKFKDGNWTIADFSFIWQTIKPFMFTHIQDNTKGHFNKRKVPHQHKNSEFLLLAMHSLIARSNIGKSNVLKELNEFMEKHQVDVVMFESAVKVGGQGIIKLHDGMAKGEVTKELNKWLGNPTVFKEFNYEDYVIQQPTPEHLIDAVAKFGSQFRNLIISDLSDKDVNGNPVIFYLPNGKKEGYTKEEIIDLYQRAIVENLLDAYKEVKGKFANIHTLQEALLQIVKDNPKYGSDIVDALQLVKTADGREVFNIPLWNPTTTDKIQEVINSFFKNNITIQKIKGGNAILVSDFGFIDDLHCVYENDKKGNKKLKAVECYMPAYSKDFYEPFLEQDNEGNDYIDIEKMQRDCPELLEAIGYRIPTEGKYSMVPLLIKGFLPQANGSAIMLPADITVHAGSDFDVDKMFLMLPEFKVYTHDLLRAKKDYEAISKDEVVNKLIDSDSIFNLNGVDTDIEETSADFKEWYNEHKDEYKYERPRVVKTKYNHNKAVQDNSKEQRNNLLIDISRSILTNHDTVDKFVSPGSFDKLKRIARISEILDDEEMLDKAISLLKKNKQLFIGEGELNTSFDLFSLSDDDLKAITSSKEKDPLSPLTFMYYHKQNMTGGALIGMYANNTTGFAKFQSKDQSRSRMSLKFEIVINGHTYKALDKIQSPNGDIVSKNCAEFSAASVDNVKDPVLAKLMQSTDTANITALMLRLGMSIEEIGLLFTQPIVKKWINAGMSSKLDDIAVEYVINNEIEDAYSVMSSTIDSSVLQYDIPMMDLVFGKILNQERYQNQLYNKNQALLTQYNISQLRILLLMSTLHDISEQLHRVTKVSRADSPNGAVAITIAGNIIQRQEVEALRTAMKAKDWMINGTDIYLDENRINANMNIDELRDAIMSSDYPMLQAFYSLGIDFTKDLMKDGHSNYFKYYEVPLMAAVKELTLASNYDTLNEKQLNNFFRNYVKYALSNIKLFKGNTGDFNQTRDFYLSEYPNRFMRLKNDYPELTDIGIIKRIIQNNKTGNLQLKDSGRITPSMRESFMRDFEYIQFKGKEDPMYARLAMDLFAYAYFKDGLYFGPNNFGQFFSPTFLNNIPNFINALRNLEVSDADNYLKQYLLNHLDEGILKELPKDDTVNKRIYKPPYQDEYSKEMFVIMNTEFILNYKDLVRGNNGKWKPKVRRYFSYEGDVYIGQDKDGQPKYEHGTYLCEYISGGPKYCTYKLIRAIDHSVRVKQSNGSYKQGSVGDRYDKSMNYQELSKYRVTKEMELFYSDVSEETPINYLNDLIVDPEIKSSEPTINTEVYTAETNENKENNCKR